jgi:hypothetical protein
MTSIDDLVIDYWALFGAWKLVIVSLPIYPLLFP